MRIKTEDRRWEDKDWTLQHKYALLLQSMITAIKALLELAMRETTCSNAAQHLPQKSGIYQIKTDIIMKENKT